MNTPSRATLLASPFPRRCRRVLMVVVAEASGAAAAAAAQPAAIACLPPEAPITNLPEAVLAEYRAEIVAEFEVYFGAVTDYIACLDHERGRVLAEARDATAAYSTILNSTPAAKDPR